MKLPKTLSELKALNAKADNVTDEHETELEEQGEGTELNLESQREPEGHELEGDELVEANEEGNVPAWLETGEEEEQEGVQVPLKAHIAQRKKFQGSISSLRTDIEQRDTQIDALSQTIEELKAAITPANGATQGGFEGDLPPVLADFEDQDNPEQAHQQALLDWSVKTFEKRQKQAEAQRKAQEIATNREAELTEHYSRAAELVGSGQITAEEWRNADAFVRQSIENFRPGQGKTIFNTLFADLGAGSEKVLISLYRKSANLNQLQRELQAAPDGLRAAMYLGRLAAEFERGSQSKISSAPRPGSKIKGDAGPKSKTTKLGEKLRSQYDEAHEKGDFSAAFAAKKQARAAGVDVSRWAYD